MLTVKLNLKKKLLKKFQKILKKAKKKTSPQKIPFDDKKTKLFAHKLALSE